MQELESQREKESEKKQKKNDRAREGPRSLLQLELDDGGGWHHRGAFSADGMRMVCGSLSLQDEIVLCGKSHTGAPTPNPLPAL